MTYQITTTTYGKLLKIVTEDATEYVLSDHNRAPVSMDPDRIEVSRRLANGTRRRYYVADKRTFQVNWSMLPSDSSQTVDGGIGAEELSSLYYDVDNVGLLHLNIARRNLTIEVVDVHITDFSLSLSKRFTNGHYYDVSMTFEEV
jgi:hypothetical protein